MKKKNALIIGFGLSGRSAASLLLAKGWQVTATDKNAEQLKQNADAKALIDAGVRLIDENTSLEMNVFDSAIISPGVPASNPVAKQVKALNKEMIGEVELAFRFIDQPVIGITGTNGKTTVTLLVTHILNHARIKAYALGNVGVPLAKELTTLPSDAILVVELSSFQIETLKRPSLNCGVLLNITPDHLDRYDSMEDYAKAKIALRNCLKPDGKFFVEEAAYKEFSALFGEGSVELYGYSPQSSVYSDGKSIYAYGKRLADLPAGLKKGKSHDLENFLAAFALCMTFDVSPELIVSAYESFRKPHHRIEFVRTVNGIHFYDDSKGTNIDAVLRAVEHMQGKIVLIAGGVDKGAAYTPWIGPFQNKVKTVFAIGQAAPKIQSDLKGKIAVTLCRDLQEAVDQAFAASIPGDNVLLSPGCSSFDMFKDYVHRGEMFQKHVNQLEHLASKADH